VHRATLAATRCFSLLPDHECAVVPIDAHQEKAAPAAYYMGPAPDGSRLGTYHVNTYEPQSRPRYDAEVVAFHEAVPGRMGRMKGLREIASAPQSIVRVGSRPPGSPLARSRTADATD
jgi:uncharacterized protein (DUF885 family)